MSARARALAVALLIVALVAGAPGAQAQAGPSPERVAHSAPIAFDFFSWVTGDENEPDEDEADEGSPQAAQGDGQSSGTSLPVIALIAVLALTVFGLVFMRLRRLYLRLRSWSRRMWTRLPRT